MDMHVAVRARSHMVRMATCHELTIGHFHPWLPCMDGKGRALHGIHAHAHIKFQMGKRMRTRTHEDMGAMV